ncbi:MAG: hypothetical protein COU90_00560 [Candidatus Ryanbacteria bacterium CG10_big_fil_rev_8_21_14_0_10_43_42]|uniref:Uncharacterized protein n=1 Tax=Candidatus Ryanbacteria bacterium CG10_big_fil_rev_8_21_14_0_10_43_42 TaxID=1974864 RepID=A0A2M8KXX9_9BACT|nr:MAG: hypothetical protein COU90_00560 [Candidatus Ryanbacteria bacterium CG10_big_fil_rev_8_21_14_0_10_43_42]
MFFDLSAANLGEQAKRKGIGGKEFLPARASDFVSATRSAAIGQMFRSKNVRAESYNSTR